MDYQMKHREANDALNQNNKSKEELNTPKRGNWGRQIEFTLSCIGYAVGLGNLWRFPYLCMRNGGGAFLIPYFLFLFICGMPLFYLELVIGQFSSLSALNVWKMSPLFKGLGWGMITVSGVMCIYYNIVITWTLYFLGMSLTSVLPWSNCNNTWNTPLCFDRSIIANESNMFNLTDTVNVTSNSTKLRSPGEEFWQFNVLELSSGIDDIGGIRWQLLVCLFAAWVLVFVCLFKGVKSSGKVVYVTATVPYVFLLILLIRGALLPGSANGIYFYIKPDFNRLLMFKTWAEACLQIFYSLGPAWGGLITMSSYNRFNNNCAKDAVVVCLACSGTSFFAGFVIFSVIGFMANDIGLPVSEVITSGPGLAFIAYPEAVTKLPISPFWAICFFLMLLTLGLDSQFATLETVTSGFVDQFPQLLRKHKTKFIGFVCVVEFAIGLPLATRAGMYFFQIMDWYVAAFSVMLIGFIECMVISWIYGLERLYYDIEMMLGYKPFAIWKVLWGVVTPILLLMILIYNAIVLTPPSYGEYVYPGWARGVGICFAMMSVVPIPAYMVYIIAAQKQGTIRERVRRLVRPLKEWGPADEPQRSQYKYAQYSTQLTQKMISNDFA